MSHTSEEWRPVPGYEGLYEVSSTQQVRSAYGGRGRKPKEVLAPRWSKAGHASVHLYDSGGKRHRVHVSILWREAFPEFRDSLPGEVWKDIPGWEYQASNLGRIRRSAQRQQSVSPYKVLKPRWRGRDETTLRAYVFLRAPGISYQRQVSRLVALAFHGPPPREDYHIHHINGDHRDNRPENLKWLERHEHWRLHKTLRRVELSKPSDPDDRQAMEDYERYYHMVSGGKG